MIKINLLPKTINQKAILRNTALIFGGVLIAIIVGGVTYGSSIKAQATSMEQQAQQAESDKARVESIQTQTKDLLASIEPVQKKLEFINAVLEYNHQYPDLFTEVTRWTYENVQYTLMAVSTDGLSLTMNARAKSLDDIGRYLLNMYRATDLFTEVTINPTTAVTAFNVGAAMPALPFQESGGTGSLAGLDAISAGVMRTPERRDWIEFSVTCKLKKPIVAPSFAGADVAPGQPGAPAPGTPAPPVR